MPNHDIATRALVVTLKSIGNKTNAEIEAITDLKQMTINSIYARVIEHGFDLNAWPLVIHNEYVQDAPCCGWSLKQVLKVIESIKSKVHINQYS